ncbi:microtubule-associated tumor suppressor 1, partial [Clarias magur]
ETFQDSVDHPSEKVQICSSNMTSVDGPMNELHQETFQDSVDHPIEEVQMCRSNMMSRDDPMIELHQDTFQDSVDHPSEEVQMCRSNMMYSDDPITELHQETFQDSVDHPIEEVQMCRSNMTSRDDAMIELHQDTFQDSVDHPIEEFQMCSSNMISSDGPMTELHQETFQDSVDHPIEEVQMCRSNMMSRDDPITELHQETFQDSVDHPSEEVHMWSSYMTSSDGPITELHQVTFQDLLVHPNEKQEVCSSTMRPSVVPFRKERQELFQDSVNHPSEEGHICSSNMTSSLGPVTEETFQDSLVHPDEKGQMCISSIGPSMGHVSALRQEIFQDLFVLPDEKQEVCSSAMRPRVEPVRKEHQEPFQDSVDHLNEETLLFSSTMRPSVSPVIELNQENFQDSVDYPIEEVQISNSVMSELHQEASHVFYNDKCKMQRATERTDVGLGNELHHTAHQESVGHQKREGQMKSSNRSLDMDSGSQEMESIELDTEENQIQTSAKRISVHLGSKIHHEGVQTNIDPTEIAPSQPNAELILNKTMQVFQGTPPSPPVHHIKDPLCFSKRNISQITNHSPDLSHTSSLTEPSKFKYTKMGLKRFSRPNLKDIKPKVISRATSAPRSVDTKYSQSALGCEKKSQITRSRATNRREQGDDGFKRNRASSTQARATTPAPITISDPEGKPTWSPMVKKQPPEPQGSKVVTNCCHVQSASSKVTKNVIDERESNKDEVVVKENPTDGDMDQKVSSDLRPPGVVARVPSRGCVSAGVRAALPGGAPKMIVIDSSPAACGSAPSCKGPLKVASSKLPIKSGNLPMSLSSSSVSSSASENKGAALSTKSEETCIRPSSTSVGKPINTKPAAGVRTRTNTHAKPNTAGQKATAHVTSSKTTQNVLHRGGAARPSRNSATVCPSSRGSRGTRAVHPHTEEEEEKKNRSILHLRSLVAHGNRRLEALAVVVQHVFNEREEALKQKKEISIQLKNVREELSQSVVCCERLEREKASVCAQLDTAVSALQQQHQAELTQLEERLREFYSAEWDRAHQQYQEQADRCTALMRQQVEDVKTKQEALRTEQEVSHSRHIEEIRQGYESMLAELQKGHERDRLELDNTLKITEVTLNERITSLAVENEALSERLRETEEKRRELAEKSQRDARVLYLEQELESLRVVLDIKNTQLHQQDKKLMQMDKLIESNVKLEEFVTKLQQENEDYKARMDKHAELS